MLLGLDLGTTNIKALVVREDGTIAAEGSAPVQLVHTSDGGVEQNIEEIWQATLSAVRQAGDGCNLSAVRAIGISSQGGAIQLRNQHGECVGPVISWLDGRGRPYDAKLTHRLGADWFARRVGHSGSMVAVGQILRLRDRDPESVACPNRVGFVGDTIVGRLTGRAAHDCSSLSIATLYNPAKHQCDADLLHEIGLKPEQLPDLLPARQPAGPLRPDIAGQLGLNAGIPVSPAVHDQYAATLGCGAIRVGDVMFGAGTAWVLLAAADRLMKPVGPMSWVCDHIVPGRWGQLVSLIVGGSVFKWACDLTRMTGTHTDEIDTLLESVPPGSDGVRLYPFHDAVGGPNRLSAGSIEGLKLAHGATHLLRAAVEGLCFELARQLDWLDKAGCSPKRLTMCGGVTKTRVTPQIVADVTGRPVVCPAQPEISAFGAAVLARAMLEPDTPLEQLAEAMSPPTRVLEPGPAAAAAYQPLLREYVQRVSLLTGL
ncbi:MAG TPA: FGGY-family carbohydrate kinase [Phycisphaerae bacterium]|nr:FGGY-family carbohydrate kinase [Phycisphaerae bacterium]